MKCLVTGAAGFIGSHLSEKLIENGLEVYGLDCFTDYYPKSFKLLNLSNLNQSNRFHFLDLDLLIAPLADILSDCDIVFHLAAQAGVRSSWGDSFEIYTNNNVLATQRVLEAARKVRIKKFVYASSSSVYGEVTEFPMRESSTVRPFSPYGVTKLAGENLCVLYSRNYGVPTVSLRYFTVYGPRQRPDMAFHIFGKAALECRQPHIFGDGQQTRDFTYVKDAVEATYQAGVLDIPPGTVINVGGGARVTLNAAIHIIYQLAGIPLDPCRQEQQKGDVSHTSADIALARKFLNYNPAADLSSGLFYEMNWLKDLYRIEAAKGDAHGN